MQKGCVAEYRVLHHLKQLSGQGMLELWRTAQPPYQIRAQSTGVDHRVGSLLHLKVSALSQDAWMPRSPCVIKTLPTLALAPQLGITC